MPSARPSITRNPLTAQSDGAPQRIASRTHNIALHHVSLVIRPPGIVTFLYDGVRVSAIVF